MLETLHFCTECMRHWTLRGKPPPTNNSCAKSRLRCCLAGAQGASCQNTAASEYPGTARCPISNSEHSVPGRRHPSSLDAPKEKCCAVQQPGPSTTACQARRTLAGTQALEACLSAQRELATLHHQRQPRVDALLRLLLRSRTAFQRITTRAQCHYRLLGACPTPAAKVQRHKAMRGERLGADCCQPEQGQRTDFLLTADTILPEVYLLLSLQQSAQLSAGVGQGVAARAVRSKLPCSRAHLTAPEVWDEGKGRYKGSCKAAARNKEHSIQALKCPKPPPCGSVRAAVSSHWGLAESGPDREDLEDARVLPAW